MPRGRRLPSAIRLAGAALFALHIGCSLPVSSEPPPFADSTLVDVLVDLHVLNAWSEVQGEVLIAEYDSVLALHGLDSARFSKALDYYAGHPEEYLIVYDEVISRLNDVWETTLPSYRGPE